MPVKLKLNPGIKPSQSEASPSSAAPSAASPAPPTPSTSRKLVKLKLGKPLPSPASEFAASGPADSKQALTARKPTNGVDKASSSKKRAANDDIAPAPKRIPVPATRKLSLKPPPAPLSSDELAAPVSAGGLPKLTLKRRPTAPKLKGLLNNKGRPIPKRKPGEGYDSEDSEVEEDPAIQQGLILRMQPGEDADYLRDAIANGRVGFSKEEGGADVSLRFLTQDFRRAVIRVRGRMYAAALVDLPCIVESMKSWDKKSWWKVADICQMLLVLGVCNSEEEAKSYALPREVDKHNMQYAHGLTAPMQWVRRRRFRKRQSYSTMANIEEQVQKLLDEDDEIERHGGTVEIQELDPQALDRPQYDDDGIDAEGNAIDSVEQQEEYLDEGEDLEDALQAAMDAGEDFVDDNPAISNLVTDSPVAMADQVASFAAVEKAVTAAENSSATGTPAVDGQDVTTTQDEQSTDQSDYDDDEDEEDEDSPDADVVDEDAVARAAEKAQQLEEVADLEREIANVRAKVNAMSNQLLRRREVDKLSKLEDDLRLKKATFGLEDEDGD